MSNTWKTSSSRLQSGRFDSPPTLREMGSGWEPLLAAAREDLYQTNGFRVLQIAVDASQRQIGRSGQMLQMQQKYGAGNTRRTLVSLDPPPDDVAVREAIQRLGDPAQRLVDEFFWFWPSEHGQSRTDKALAALAAGQTQRAYETWKQQEQNNGHSAVATHNIAVLAHLRALDLEYSFRERALDQKEAEQLQRAWRHCFTRWQKLLTAASFWERLAERIHQLDDPRLRPEVVAKFRSSLPLALLLINARIAATAANEGRRWRTGRHLAMIRHSGFSADYIREACQRAVAPSRELVRVACQTAKQRVERNPLAGARVATDLLRETAKPLGMLDAMLPEQNAMRVSSHDEVASTALSCQIAFGNKTEDWSTSLKILQHVAQIAASGSMRRRIEENVRIVQGNLEAGNFWCGEGYWELPQTTRATLEKARDHHRLNQFDQAIALLEPLLGDVDPASLRAMPERNPYRLVGRAMSVCLNSRALSRLNRAMEEFQRPLPILLQIANNPAFLALGAVRVPGITCCAMCGEPIYGSYSILTFKGVEIVLCPRHAHQAKREQERKKRQIADALRETYADLRRATELCPGNRAAEQNLVEVRKMAREAGIPLREPLASSECFIATTAFGTAMHADVEYLRQYRDRVLLQHRLGRTLVAMYYRVSPPIAALLRRTATGRRIVRAVLRPVVAACRRRLEKTGGDHQSEPLCTTEKQH